MPVVILDGPMGTELERLGVALPEPGWSARALVSAPDQVARVHRAYAEAGARIHTANTFRTRRRDAGEGWATLAVSAVQIARASASGGLVAGSIGPVEDCYHPERSPGRESRGEHGELARVLRDAGADLLLCETFASADEARAAVSACVEAGVETWASLTSGPDANLMAPRAMREAARTCVEEGAHVVLVNCTAATRIAPFVEGLAELGVPFGVYANAGSPDERLGWESSAEAGSESKGAGAYLALAQTWVALGASVVGGCCGTGPAHIRALAQALTPLSRALPRAVPAPSS